MPPRGTRKLREIESEGKKGRERKNPEQIRANSREGYYWSLLLGSERRQLITDREVCSRELWQSLPVTRSFASKLRPSLPPPASPALAHPFSVRSSLRKARVATRNS